MSGKDASRGFLFQIFASILNALIEESNWDKIYIEPIENEKVDIKLKKENKTIKCVQVKSSINIFKFNSIKKWLEELIKDIDCPEYELFLIGHCDETTNTFIKSINKYYTSKKFDAEMETILKDFKTDLLKNRSIKIQTFPFGDKILETVTRDSLHKYISNILVESISFEKLNLITSAIVTDFFKSSTNTEGIDRNKFDEDIKNRIKETIENPLPKRITIKIRSFIHKDEKNEEIEKDRKDENTLFLVNDFSERELNENLDWNKDISKKVINFLKEKTNKNQPYALSLISHSSIAFLAGRQLNSKSGVDIFPMQNGTILWDVNLEKNKNSKDSLIKWKTPVYEQLDSNLNDYALILSINHNIYNNVIEYINSSKLPIGKIINCSLEIISSHSVKDGTHAYLLANSVNDCIKERSIEERQSVLHIFSAVPNAFMFFLGQNSNGFGKCILYEFDYEQKNSCTYSPSIKFID